MSRHAETILAAVATQGATSPVATSWRRCAVRHGLDPDDRTPPEGDTRMLRDGLERDAELIATAQPYLDLLFDCLGDPDGGVSIIDRDGTMLALRTGKSQDAWKRRSTRLLGANLTERSIGTNGNGTCLAEERPVSIRGGEHFLAILTHTICIAAPIFGPDGRIAGCLNALTMVGGPADLRAEALIQLAVSGFARRIETELFVAAFPKARVMLASNLGRHPGALLAVDRDDVVVGATRSARRLLELSDSSLVQGLNLDALREGTADDLAGAERRLVARALARHGGNVSAAAKSIGISRSTFYRKLQDVR